MLKSPLVRVIVVVGVLCAVGSILHMRKPTRLPRRSGQIIFKDQCLNNFSDRAIWIADLDSGVLTRVHGVRDVERVDSVLGLEGGRKMIRVERGNGNWTAGSIVTRLGSGVEKRLKLPDKYLSFGFIAGYDCRRQILVLSSHTDILLCDQATGRTHQVTTKYNIFWSPVCAKGGLVAGVDDRNGDIVLISVTDGAVRGRFSVGQVRRPVLSPTGRQIAYYVYGRNALVLADIRGTALHTRLSVKLPARTFCRAEWSPDAKTVAIELDKCVLLQSVGFSELYLADSVSGRLWKTPWEVDRGCWRWCGECDLRLQAGP